MPVLSYNITWYWFVYNFPYGVNIHTAVPSVESCVFGTWLSSGLDYDRHTRHFVSYENKHCRTKWGSSKYFPEWEKNIKSYSMHSEWNRIQELLYDISVRFVAAYRCASRCWKFDILSSALDRAVTRHQRPPLSCSGWPSGCKPTSWTPVMARRWRGSDPQPPDHEPYMALITIQEVRMNCISWNCVITLFTTNPVWWTSNFKIHSLLMPT